jgi:hypothetical protein
MNSINEAYKRVYLKEESKEFNLSEAAIGQRIKMGKTRSSDGDILIDIAKNIEKLQK